ncbi:MAG: PAS domain S-box protein [Planctomycetes bacterium]|nr:PAS domain S-box protein [Planctomycetota bacterium]
MSRRYAIVVLLWMVAPWLAGAHGETYPISGFSDLRGVIVRAIHRDTGGRIWLATDSGLWRWGECDFESLQALVSLEATGLAEDTSGTLWVGTKSGVAALDVITGTLRWPQRLLPGSMVHCLHRDKQGRVWCGTGHGLYRLESGADTGVATLVAGTADHEIVSVTVGQEGDLWAGSQRTLLHLHNGQVERCLDDRVGGGHVRTLLQAADGGLWIGVRTPGGLYRLADGDLRRFTAQEGLLGDEVNSLVEGPNDTIWVGTEDGIFRWTGERFLAIDRSSGLENSDVHSLLVDDEEQVWIGSYGGGVYVLRSPHIRLFQRDDGLRHPVVTALTRDGQGRLLAGTLQGATRFTPNLHEAENVGPAMHVNASHVDAAGNLWLGGPAGFWRTGAGPQNPAVRDVLCFTDGGEGQVLGGAASGLWVFEGEQVRRQPLPDGISGPVQALARGPNGTTYVGTAQALLCLRAGEWRILVADCDVRAIGPITAELLWLGTATGLRAVQMSEPATATTDDYAVGPTRAVLRDRAGDLWAATGDGLVRVRQGDVARFGLRDGVPSRDVRALALDPAGQICAGTTQGLAVIDPNGLQPCRARPYVRLARFMAGGRVWQPGAGILDVPYEGRHLLVRVESLGWRSTAGVRYRYKLVGRDADWSTPTAQSIQQYAELRPGSYTFLAKCVNARGLESKNVARVEFAIGPPFWWKAWFIALLAAGGLGLATLLTGFFVKRAQLHAERERTTAALRQARDELELRVEQRTAALAATNEELRKGVAERVEAERAVRREQKLLQLLMDNVPDNIYFKDRKSRFTRVNRALAEFYEVARPEDVVGKTDADFYPPELAEEFRADEQRILQSGFSIIEKVEPALREDNDPRWYSTTKVPLRDTDGTIVGLVGISRDITRRRRAEEAVRRARDELELRVKERTERLTAANQRLRQEIAERRRAEEALRANEERMHATFSALHESAIVVFDRDGRCTATWSSEEFDQRTGLPAASMVGHLLTEVFSASAATGKMVQLRRVIDSGQARREDAWHEMPNGSFWFEVSLSPIRNSEGEVTDVVVFIRDATERKQAEDALRRQALIFDSIYDGVLVADLNGGIVDWNPGAERIFGYQEKEVLGRSPELLYRDSATGGASRAIREGLNGGERWVGEVEFVRKDGTAGVCETVVVPFEDERGRCIGTISVNRDVTERKQAEEELREFKTICDAANYGTAMADLRGYLTYVNSAFAEMHGYQPSELIGQHLSTFHTAEQMDRVNALNEGLIRDGHFSAAEVWHKHRDGRVFPTLMNASVISDEAGRPFCISATALDITERIRAEEALRASEQRFRLATLATRDAIYDWDIVADRSWRNERYHALFKPPDETSSAWWRERIHPADRARIEQELRDAFADRDAHWAAEFRFLLGDGEYADVIDRGFIVRGPEGQPIRMIGAMTDMTKRKQAQDALRLQRDLGLALSSTSDLRQATEHVLDAVLRIEGVDCGGVCLVDELSGVHQLIAQRGLSAAFAERVSRLGADSDQARLLAGGEPVYGTYADLFPTTDETLRQEGLRGLALIPVFHADRIVATLNAASHTQSQIPAHARETLEMIAAQIGDVIARIQTTVALRASERRYRAIVEDQTELICRWAPGGVHTFVNEAYCRCFGRNSDELVGSNLMNLIPEEDHERTWAHFNSLSCGNSMATHEHRVIADNGEIRWQQWTDRAICDEQGTIVEYQSAGRDITARKQAEEALRRSEETARAILNASTDFVLLLDADGTCLAANDSCAQSFRLTAEEVVGRRVYDLVPPHLAESRRARLREGIDTGRAIQFEDEHAGTWLEHQVYPVFDSAGQVDRLAVFARDITERKRAAEALREAEERLRSTIASMDDLVFVMDEQGVYVDYYQSQAQRELYVPPAEFLGKSYRDVLPSAVAERMGAAVDAVIATDSVQQVEYCLDIAGEARWYSAKTSARRDAAGVISGITVVARNITEQKRAAETLRESEELFRTVVGASWDAMVAIDDQGLITIFNPAAEKMFKYSREEMLGQPLDLLMPAEYREQHRQRVADFHLSGGSGVASSGRTLELLALRSDGREFPIELSLAAGQRRDGSFLLAVIRDITERKQAEQALRASEARFRALTETVAAATFIYQESRICYANAAATGILGYAREEFSRRSFVELFHADSTAAVKQHSAVLLRGEDVPARFEARALAKGGAQRWLDVSACAFEYEGEPAVLATAFDVTERVRAEELARTHQAELTHVSRLSLVGELASGLAHEVNQPLSTILYYARGCTRRASNRAPNASELLEIMERIAAQAERAGGIVNRIRDFVRKADPRPVWMDINGAVQEALDLAEAEIKRKRIQLRLDLAEAAPRVYADRIQIEQVVLNLVYNAIEAMQDIEVAERQLRIATRCQGGSNVLVTVTDSGPGFPPETAHQLFDPFFSTKTEGMGMGLSVSRSIIETHEGRLWATAGDGRGSTFQFTLPMGEGSA